MRKVCREVMEKREKEDNGEFQSGSRQRDLTTTLSQNRT